MQLSSFLAGRLFKRRKLYRLFVQMSLRFKPYHSPEPAREIQRTRPISYRTTEMAVHMEPKLAIFLPSLSGGGAERSMLNLAHGVAERGYPVDLVLAQAKGPYLSGVHKSVRIVDLKASRVMASLPALARYLRKERPEALISALNYANVIALWARRLVGVPKRVLVNEQ